MRLNKKESRKEIQKLRENYYGQFNIRQGEITKDKRGIALPKTGQVESEEAERKGISIGRELGKQRKDRNS